MTAMSAYQDADTDFDNKTQTLLDAHQALVAAQDAADLSVRNAQAAVDAAQHDVDSALSVKADARAKLEKTIDIVFGDAPDDAPVADPEAESNDAPADAEKPEDVEVADPNENESFGN